MFALFRQTRSGQLETQMKYTNYTTVVVVFVSNIDIVVVVLFLTNNKSQCKQYSTFNYYYNSVLTYF